MTPITTTTLRDILTGMVERDGDQPIWLANVGEDGGELMTLAYSADHEGRHGGLCALRITRLGWTSKGEPR